MCPLLCKGGMGALLDPWWPRSIAALCSSSAGLAALFCAHSFLHANGTENMAGQSWILHLAIGFQSKANLALLWCPVFVTSKVMAHEHVSEDSVCRAVSR